MVVDFIKNNELIKKILEKKDINVSSDIKSLFIDLKYETINDNLIILVDKIDECIKLYEELINFRSNVYMFPFDEFNIDYKEDSSDSYFLERVTTLINIINEKSNKIIITNYLGFIKKITNKNDFINSIKKIKVNDKLDIKKLEEYLINVGYQKEYTTYDTGSFSKRGEVFDIFIINSQKPIRINFFDDTVESIYEYDEITQRRTNKIDEIIIYPFNDYFTNNYTNILEFLDAKLIIYNKTDLYSYINELDKESNYLDFNIKINNYIQAFDYNIEHDLINEDLANFNSNEELIINYIKTYSSKYKLIFSIIDNYFYDNFLESLKKHHILFDIESTVKSNVIITKKYFKTLVNNNLDFQIISSKTLIKEYIKQRVNQFRHIFKKSSKILDPKELNINDYVVHVEHGIGIYKGIKSITTDNITKDYLYIEYKNNSSLYVPVDKINLINKYADKDTLGVSIHEIGSKEWKKTKENLKNKVYLLKDKLLKIYKEKEESIGYKFDLSYMIDYEKFCNNFNYELTPDQKIAIDEIISDMTKEKVMDRLLCADVGYGKTECAIRASFLCVSNLKQVVILCPTTILSKQHYKTFINRFAGFNVNIKVINRFVSKKDQQKIIDDLKKGDVNILIGTHRVLSNDVIFNDLGLVIIDEEQRFGVIHKERLKELKASVDTLTLSATPIPRTLQMSLVNIKDISYIKTPPKNRYPIKTYVMPRSNEVIIKAINKEIMRGGKVFYLYNRIEDIVDVENKIKEMCSNAVVTHCHGQLAPLELENRLSEFIDGNCNVLVATSIIETGIDIPSANTLIVHDAPSFGLSQLYQIRGRVGRSNLVAYSYMFYELNKNYTDEAIKRLEVIKELNTLGSGFKLAKRDLQIRGAGDLLGKEQSGFITSVGFEYYKEVLDEVILNKKIVNENKDVKTPILALSISDKYIEDEKERINIHKKIENIKDYEMFNNIYDELTDRFGKIDDMTLMYMYDVLFNELINKYHFRIEKNAFTKINLVMDSEYAKDVDGIKYFNNILNYKDLKIKYENKKIYLYTNQNTQMFESVKQICSYLNSL